MATTPGGPVLINKRHLAGADLSAKQFYFVKLSAGEVVLCSGATDVPMGVLLNAPADGELAEVAVFGGVKVVASGDLAVGGQIGTDANGKAAVYAPGTDTTKYIVGTLVEDPGADGDIVGAYINCIGAGAGRGA